MEQLAAVDAHEGPVYVPAEDALYFTTVPGGGRSAIKRLDLTDRTVSVVAADANRANGMTLDHEGRLVICEQGGFDTPARITRLDLASGEAETLADAYAGRPLNSPNDVVVSADGAIWFTDPSYGHLQGFRPAPALPDRVYRLDPATGRLDVAADGLDKPNGLAFARGEETLYVTDSGTREVIALEAGGRRRLAATDLPDGIVTDAAGSVYVSSSTGVQVFDASGEWREEIPAPGAVNLTWGGRDGDVLFITTDTAVFAAVLTTRGA
jgi:gluconolactonase